MTNTFSFPTTNGWVMAVDGAAYQRVGIQIDRGTVKLAVATAEPAAATGDYVSLSSDGSKELVLNLASADKVYVKSGGAYGGVIRGFREGRA